MANETRYAAWSGIAAAAAALGIGELTALGVSARSAPLVAVGAVVIDAVPAPVKAFAIRVFGTYDKLALQVGTVIIVIGVAAMLGVAARRRLWAGIAGISAFGVIGAIAALTRSGSSTGWALPSVAAAVAGALALVGLLRPLLARYARVFSPGLHVLSQNEIPDRVAVNILGSLG